MIRAAVAVLLLVALLGYLTVALVDFATADDIGLPFVAVVVSASLLMHLGEGSHG